MRISDWSSDVCSSDLEGPIRVGDVTFDGHMPSFASALDDAEIARLVTYLRERFAGRRQGISDERVSALRRSEEHTSELQSLMRISYAVSCLKKKISNITAMQNLHSRRFEMQPLT